MPILSLMNEPLLLILQKAKQVTEDYDQDYEYEQYRKIRKEQRGKLELVTMDIFRIQTLRYRVQKNSLTETMRAVTMTWIGTIRILKNLKLPTNQATGS